MVSLHKFYCLVYLALPNILKDISLLSNQLPTEFQGVKKVSGPMLSPHVLPSMLIHICHTMNDDYATETMITNFLKYNK
jgi:hypothetical protein